MITNKAKPYALQSIIFFILCKWAGKTRLEAIQEFLRSDLCKQFNNLTVGNVWGLAEAGGY